MRILVGMVPVLFACPALAQEAGDRQPAIQVVGTATVSTKPDVANLVYWVTGEGKTADEASSSLATKQKAIVGGLAGLLGRDTQLSSGEVSVDGDALAAMRRPRKLQQSPTAQRRAVRDHRLYRDPPGNGTYSRRRQSRHRSRLGSKAGCT